MSAIRPSSFFGSSSSGSSGRSTPRSSTPRSSTEMRSSISLPEPYQTPPNGRSQTRDDLSEIKEMIKEHSKLLKNLETAIKAVGDQLEEVRENMCDDDEDDRIPPEISSDVHLIYSKFGEDEVYHPHESITSQHNSSVRHALEEEITSKDKGYPVRLIKRAVSRYYETKRKMYLQTLPENQEKAARVQLSNKLRSRRKRLYISRLKAGNEQEKAAMKELTYDYVSDEEDGEGPNRGKWVVRKPSWRSGEGDNLMKRLQEKIDASSSDRPRFTRVPGGLSSRGKPKNPVTWAVNDDLPRPSRSSVPSSGSREQENQQSSTNDLPRRERSRSPARSLSQRQSRRMSSKSPSSSPERPRRSRSRSPSSEVTRRTRSRSPSPQVIRNEGVYSPNRLQKELREDRTSNDLMKKRTRGSKRRSSKNL